MRFLKKCIHVLGLFPAATTYQCLSIKNRYPCRVVGERIHSDTQETVVIYKITPRKEEFEISLKELLNQPLLIEKFHPTEALRLGFMAFGEIFFNQPKDAAYAKYQDIIKKMGDHGGGG